MASPRVLIQILITGTQIFGKALLAAGKQAAKNAKTSPQGALGNDVAGVGNATSGSITDQLTRQHRMTVDEAHLILNTKRGEELSNILKNYEHLFKANSPSEAPPRPKTGKQTAPPSNSHYLQSKVVRARERLEAELKVAEEPKEPPTTSGPTATPPPEAPPGPS